ncbi:MAG TPA: DUF1361 domain-containing protein [Gaiellales bacterium]|jgi:uncharacterized membrane protein|nr:DUF1361 domain-containing protein [Gaiellales bacterium]
MAHRAPAESTPVSRVLDGARGFALSPLCIALLTVCCYALRLLRTDAGIGPHYAFVGANLVLAWIPLLLAYALSWSARSGLRWLAIPPLVALWILFLPNAPYLVTDLVHLQDGVNSVNVALLSLLALIGVLIGVKSVRLVQGVVERLFGAVAGWRAVQAVAVLTAAGIYLGRVLRWNSWTVVHHPELLPHAVLRSTSEPARLGMALLVTAVSAVCFLVVYRVLAGPRIVSAPRPVRGGTTR